MICILARKKEIRTRRLHHVLQVSLAAMSLHIVKFCSKFGMIAKSFEV